MEGETKLYHELICVADPGLCYGHLLVVLQFLKKYFGMFRSMIVQRHHSSSAAYER